MRGKNIMGDDLDFTEWSTLNNDGMKNIFPLSPNSPSEVNTRSPSEDTGFSEEASGDSLDEIPDLANVEDDCLFACENQTSLNNCMNALIQLYKLFGGSVRSAELRSFVDRYSNQIMGERKDNVIEMDSFSCPSCHGIWVEPVTIPCGHSYCRKCIVKLTPGESCRKCNYSVTYTDIYQTKVNVLMVALIEKFWPRNTKVSLLRDEGNRLFERRILQDSFWKYSEAIRLCPDDFMSWSNRSHVQLVLGKTEAALEDAETAISICPVWPKGYFRKASAMIKLDNLDDAFVNLTVCMYIIKLKDLSGLRPVQNELSRIIHKLFLNSGGVCPGGGGALSTRRHSVDHLLFSPYPSPKTRSANTRLLAMSGELSDSEAYYSSGDEVESVDKTFFGKHRDTHVQESKSCPYLPAKGINCKTSNFDSTQQFVIRIRNLFEATSKALFNIREKVLEINSSYGPFPNSSATVVVENLECSLCYRLFHVPVVTPCGHTYCRTCLERSLDHSSNCPLCKTPLFNTLSRWQLKVTDFVDKLICRFLPSERVERLQQHLEEISEVTAPDRNNEIELLIFVCTVAFPGVACPLHVFEPRYRLMIRRVMESESRKFGMCCYLEEAEGNYANYGTLLKVTNVQHFPDGRSVVDTIGMRRFKVLKKNVKDGYNTATIEYLFDKPVHPDEKQKLIESHRNVYSEAEAWLISINALLKQRISTHFGIIPEPEENWMEISDGPSWIWWLLAILPLDSKAQLAILSMDSLQKRLDSILKVLNYVKTTHV